MISLFLFAVVAPPAVVEPIQSTNTPVVCATQADVDAALRAPATGTVIKVTGTVNRVVIPDGSRNVTVQGDPGSQVVSKDGSKPPVVVGLKCVDITLRGLNIARDPAIDAQRQYSMIAVGYDSGNTREAATTDELANRVLIDGCTITGRGFATRIGVLANARNVTVQNCTITGINDPEADSQGILQTNTPGPSLITKCYIEAAGENYMSGGSKPTIPNLQLADLTFVDNALVKPMAWKGDSKFWVKNLFELKGMQRAFVARNRMCNVWEANQNGTAFLLTPRDGSRVADIRVEANWIDNCGAGFLITGGDNVIQVPKHTGEIEIVRNIVTNVGAQPGGGYVWHVGTYAADHQIDALTIADNGWTLGENGKGVLFFEAGAAPAVTWLSISGNLGPYGRYGLLGDGKGPGDFAGWSTNFSAAGNVILQSPAPVPKYPAGFMFR